VSSPKLGSSCGQGRMYGSRGLHPPDPCGQAPPDTLTGSLSGGVPTRPKTNFVDKGAFTGRVGCAHPTDAPDDRLDPSQGLRP